MYKKVNDDYWVVKDFCDVVDVVKDGETGHHCQALSSYASSCTFASTAGASTSKCCPKDLIHAWTIPWPGWLPGHKGGCQCPDPVSVTATQ